MRGVVAVVLLLSILSVPQVPAAEPPTELWYVEDPAGDVVTDPEGGSAAMPTASMDLRRLALVSETEDLLEFRLTFDELERATEPVQLTNEIRVEARFHLDDDTAYTLRFRVWGGRSFDDPPSVFRAQSARMDFCTRPSSGSHECREGRPAFLEGESVLARIPRAWLANDFREVVRGPHPNPDRLVPVKAGSFLSGLSATAYEEAYISFGVRVTAEDRMPDAGPSETKYALKHTNANQAIHVFAPNGGYYYYAPGTNQSFAFTILNKATGRQLLRLQYGVEGDAAAVSSVRVSGPATVTIPAGQSRNYTLAVLTTGPNAPLELVVRAESVGTNEVGVMRAALENGTVVGPDRSTLYFHFAGPPPGDPDCTFNECLRSRLLSPASQVEGYRRDVQDDVTWGRDYPTRPSIASPLALQKGGKAVASLRFTTPHVAQEYSLRVQLTYFAPGGPFTFLKFEGEEHTIEPTGTVVAFSGVPKTKLPVIEAPGSFVLQVGGWASAHVPLVPDDPISLDLAGSTIRLPLVEVPEEFKTVAVPSPFQMSVLGDKDEFVNPGEGRLYNVSVTNIDAMEQHVRLTYESTKPWRVDVLPHAEYNLPPGQSITVGIVVHAPPEAVEGDTAILRVNATADNGGRAGVRLSAVAVALDQPDDRGRFKADVDDAALAVTPAAKSPGPPLLVALAVAWALVRRRRP